MSLFRCPHCSLPLTDTEALLENCAACGELLPGRTPSPPAPTVDAAAAENRSRRRRWIGMLVGGCAAAVLLIVALLIWHANSGRREILAVAPPAPASPQIAKNKPEPDLAQPAVAAEPKPGSDRAPVVYPPVTIAKAKALGDGLTESDAGMRAKPGGLPAAGDDGQRAPQVADERPGPRVAPDFGADPFAQNPFLRDKDLGGLLQRPGAPGNALDQLLKMAEERNQEIEKLLNAGGGQGADLLDAVKAIQGFGKLQRLPAFPALPGARLPAPKADDPDAGRASDVDELTLSGDSIGDKSLLSLRGLATLRVLSISRTSVTDAGLEHLKGLKGLRQLYLSGTAVTDKGLEHLHGLTELRVLDVTNTRVTDAGIKRLQQALPAVKITH